MACYSRIFARLPKAASLKLVPLAAPLVVLRSAPRLFPAPTYSRSRLASPFSFSQPYSTSHIPTESEVDQISADDFHKISDEAMENILTAYEELAESIPDLDVELSQGVLTLYLPPNGSYVINKQPPNKQIWWSSPISGPKRFDRVGGTWASLRDGTTLKESLEEETNTVTKERNLDFVEFDV